MTSLAEIRQRNDAEIEQTKPEFKRIMQPYFGKNQDDIVEIKGKDLLFYGDCCKREAKKELLSEIEGEMNDNIDAVLNEQPSNCSSDWNPEGIDIDLEMTRSALKQKLLGVDINHSQQDKTSVESGKAAEAGSIPAISEDKTADTNSQSIKREAQT